MMVCNKPASTVNITTAKYGIQGIIAYSVNIPMKFSQRVMTNNKICVLIYIISLNIPRNDKTILIKKLISCYISGGIQIDLK